MKKSFITYLMISSFILGFFTYITWTWKNKEIEQKIDYIEPEQSRLDRLDFQLQKEIVKQKLMIREQEKYKKIGEKYCGFNNAEVKYYGSLNPQEIVCKDYSKTNVIFDEQK